MARPWSEIEASDDYKLLEPSQQSNLKMDYFEDIISKSDEYNKLDSMGKSQLQNEFLGDLSTGRIITPETKKKEIKETQGKHMLATAGQFIGGMGGGLLGGMVGRPYIGGAIGGTAGRATGRLEQFISEMPLDKKLAVNISALAGPGVKAAVAYANLSPAKKNYLKNEVMTTAAIESFLGVGAGAATRAVKWLGRGIGAQWLGPRVTERGISRGWNRILRPDYYKNEVPIFLKEKLGNFFPRLLKITGSEIDEVLKKAPKDTHVDMNMIKEEVRKILPPGGNVADFLEMHAPPVQANLLQHITDLVMKSKGKIKSVHKLWNLRKYIDKTIYGRNWTPEAGRYLKGLRNILNKPLKSVAGDKFNTFAWVADAMEKYGKKFTTRKGLGQAYSPDIEQFAKGLLDPGKDEIVKELVQLDGLLPKNQKIIEELLDYAASETLERPVGQFGLIGRTALGFTGGRKGFARIGQAIQSPKTQTLSKVIGRTIPTAWSAVINSELPEAEAATFNEVEKWENKSSQLENDYKIDDTSAKKINHSKGGITNGVRDEYMEDTGIELPPLKDMKPKHINAAKKFYVNKYKLGKFNDSVFATITDWAFNAGPDVIKIIQKEIGTKVDGHPGKETNAAIKKYGPAKLRAWIRKRRKKDIDAKSEDIHKKGLKKRANEF